MKQRSSVIKITFLATLLRYWQQIGVKSYYIALPVIAIAMGASSHTMKMTVSSFFLGYALAEFLSGYFISAVSIRKVLYLAMILFTIATVICLIADNVIYLFVGRTLQALALGTLPIVSKTLLALVPEKERSNVFSYSDMGIQLSGPLGMIVTGYLVSYLPWQTVFIFMFLMALISYLPLYITGRGLLVEYHKAERFDFAPYKELIKRWRFNAWVIAYGTGMAMFNVYFLGISFILIHNLRVDAHLVGWLTAFVILTQMIGLFVSVYVSNKFSNMFLIFLGLTGMVGGAVTMLILAMYYPPTIFKLVWPIIISTIGCGIFYGPFNNQLLLRQKKIKAEYIISLSETSISVISMLATFMIALFHHLTAVPLACILIALSVVTFLLICTTDMFRSKGTM